MAVAVGQAHVSEAEIVRAFFQGAPRVGHGAYGIHLQVHTAEGDGKQLANIAFVIDDQDGLLAHVVKLGWDLSWEDTRRLPQGQRPIHWGIGLICFHGGPDGVEELHRHGIGVGVGEGGAKKMLALIHDAPVHSEVLPVSRIVRAT